MEQLNKKKFKLFDMNRDGKGVDPGEDTTPNLKFFFKLLWRKLSKIITLNMLAIVQILPLLACLYLYFIATPTTPTQYYPEYAALYGMQEAASSATSSLGVSLFSFQHPLPTYNTYIYWVIGVLLLFQVVTYGWQKVGVIYVTRGLVRGDSVFVWSDYFYAIKKNLKQGFILGLIDCIAMFALAFDIYYFYTSPQTGMNNFMYVLTIALIVLYIIFRFYVYLMAVTFDMKIGKIFKNALIFIVLGIKRNIMALLGLAILTAFAVLLVVLFLPMGLGVTIVLPLIYYLGVCAFIYTYAAYPVIKKYMIDPVGPTAPTEEE
ncbi:MAG: DUF624 domain-containing protein [Ruminococcaceae bacterium]|nr:DUF624 domain-containing protein [Oscillospiraceae bacterium]